MFVMDMPHVPQQYTPVVVAQATQRQTSDKSDRTIGVCQLIENQPESLRSAINGLSPLQSVSIFFGNVENRQVGIEGRVSLLQGPAHGTLEELGGVDRGGYLYVPMGNFVGQDRATFLVKTGGFNVKVMYFFNVLEGVADDMYENRQFCPNGEIWKISLSPGDPNVSLYTFEQPSQLTNAIKANLTIADSPFGALGQTTGTSITLNDNAAGHGWFIDSTPWSNEEPGRVARSAHAGFRG